MTATICAGCDQVIVEHGRGYMHLDTGNYRCTWAWSGDGFACPVPTPEEEMATAEANRQDGYDEGYADAEKRLTEERQAGYDEGYADARSNYDINDF